MQLEISEIRYNVEQIVKKQKGHDQNIELLFEYIDRLQEKEEEAKPKPRYSKGEIGFKIGGKGDCSFKKLSDRLNNRLEGLYMLKYYHYTP